MPAFALLLILLFKPSRKALEVLSIIAFVLFCAIGFFARQDIFSNVLSALILVAVFYGLGRLILFLRERGSKDASPQ